MEHPPKSNKVKTSSSKIKRQHPPTRQQERAISFWRVGDAMFCLLDGFLLVFRFLGFPFHFFSCSSSVSGSAGSGSNTVGFLFPGSFCKLPEKLENRIWISQRFLQCLAKKKNEESQARCGDSRGTDKSSNGTR